MNREFDYFLAKPSKDVKENNSKILKFLNFELRLFESKINESIMKIKEFLNDLSVKEATNYLIKTFSEFVR